MRSEGYIILVVVLCMYVCVHSNLPPHTKERYQRIHRNTFKKIADFPTNASFKSYGVICSPRAAPAS